MPAHGQIEELVPVETVRGDGVDQQVQAELERGEPREKAPRAQASLIPSFSTQTLVAKKSRIIAA
jgi:hypothetical protein